MKPTDHSPLKQASQDFFAKQQLSEDSLNRFTQLLSQAQVSEQNTSEGMDKKENDNSVTSKASRQLKFLAMTASIVAVASLSSVWLTPNQNSIAPDQLASLQPSSNDTRGLQEMIAAIANEVTKNHIKLKPLEVTSQDFSVVRDYFTQLDFAPQISTHFPKLAATGLTMMGGRYCSIQSETAAQLRYQEKNTALKKVESTGTPVALAETPWSTLYQTQYKPSTFGELPQVEQGQAPIETYSRGLKVSIWIERQLLMVSVEDAPSDKE